ncbi:DUF5317 family protein [Catellatospora bangladeshensis]|uniref:Uncharacterized protein n=1 Tax=Catellatospora bangladeshensis TaxID=310355 RepID=A0A8J3JQU2_9ACTN|nr:DUF5317 family protein [Catellatospora bangladeshensis]GIF81549.1 hypothetical protein Cba03nite_28980 [Catellatospora bangladeshensis]
MTAVPSLTAALFIASPLLVAGVMGVLLGRDPLRLTRLRLRWIALLWAAAAIAALRYADPGWLPQPLRQDSGLALAAATWTLSAAWVGVNLRGRTRGQQAGLSALLAGAAANALAIAVNGGEMPYAQPAGQTGADTTVGHAAWEAGQHRLYWLSDVIAVPGTAVLLSVGDLLLIGGITTLLVAAMRPRRITDPLASEVVDDESDQTLQPRPAGSRPASD